jgi:dTDP-4-amino-4,6-dideoxygalactose transaminase
MTDFQAAMGMEQLKKLPDFIERRRAIAKSYNAAFSDLPVRLPTGADSGAIWFRYVLHTKRAEELIRYLQQNGISAAKPVFRPIHLFIGKSGDCPVAELAWMNTVSLPIYPSLPLTVVAEIAELVKRFFSAV